MTKSHPALNAHPLQFHAIIRESAILAEAKAGAAAAAVIAAKDAQADSFIFREAICTKGTDKD